MYTFLFYLRKILLSKSKNRMTGNSCDLWYDEACAFIIFDFTYYSGGKSHYLEFVFKKKSFSMAACISGGKIISFLSGISSTSSSFMVTPCTTENIQSDPEIVFHCLWKSLILPPVKLSGVLRKLPTWGTWGFTSWSLCPSPSGSGLCPDPSTVRLLLESLCPWRSAWVWLLPLDFCISDPDTEDISA